MNEFSDERKMDKQFVQTRLKNILDRKFTNASRPQQACMIDNILSVIKEPRWTLREMGDSAFATALIEAHHHGYINLMDMRFTSEDQRVSAIEAVGRWRNDQQRTERPTRADTVAHFGFGIERL